MFSTMIEVNQAIRQCTDCSLCKGINHHVPGIGSFDTDLMLIGEGPGAHEDRTGFPFMGPAGELLEELLRAIGFTRADVFITNMIKCRAPGNRDPQTYEVAACNKYLDAQIRLVNPKVIVPLGRYSLWKFFPKAKISEARGKIKQQDGRYIYPVMHPAAALHKPVLKDLIVADFLKIPEVIEMPWPKQVTQRDTGEQLSLI